MDMLSYFLGHLANEEGDGRIETIVIPTWFKAEVDIQPIATIEQGSETL